MEAIQIKNTVLFGDYEEVKNLPLASIVKNDTSGEKLDGIILKGYETKFNGTKNETGEVFDKDCLNDFIEKYFVKNKLNIPVDLLHITDIDHLCGRVLVLEVNSVGFYFVVYVPKSYKHYDYLKDFLLKEKIIQGFSKLGWATEYVPMYDKQGNWDYIIVKKMELIKVSLVDVPSNGVGFEEAKEIKNATQFINKNKSEKKSFYN